MHSVGYPLVDIDGNRRTTSVAVDADNKYIVHFPEAREIWSYGSGYGGNALLGRSASLSHRVDDGRDDGWLAEHMLILGLTRRGRSDYVAVVPFGVRQDQHGDADPHPARVEGRDHRRRHRLMKIGDDGRNRDQPGGRVLRVAPGTGEDTNPNAVKTLHRNSIFTNVATTDDGDVWWEGMTGAAGPPHGLAGQRWTPDSDAPAAHPNAASRRRPQCPSIAPSGRTRTACRSRPSSSAAVALPTCRW